MYKDRHTYVICASNKAPRSPKGHPLSSPFASSGQTCGLPSTHCCAPFDRLLVHGAPPKVIWVRLGNVRKNALIELLLSRWPAMQLLLETNDLVEVYHDRLEALSFPQPSGTA